MAAKDVKFSTEAREHMLRAKLVATYSGQCKPVWSRMARAGKRGHPALRSALFRGAPNA
jgi:hypothetical protein